MKHIFKILTIVFLTTIFNTQIRAAACIPSAAAPTIPVVYFGDLTNYDDVLALMLALKDERLSFRAIYIVSDGFADGGATIQYVYNILDWMGRGTVPVFIGSAYSTIDTELPAGGPHDETWAAAVPKGSNGKFLIDSLWGIQHLLPQSPRHYQPPLLSSSGFEDDINAINAVRAIIAASTTQVHILSFGPLTGPKNVLLGGTFPAFPAPIVVPPALPAVTNNIASFLQMGGDLNLGAPGAPTRGNVLFFFNEICRSEFNIFLDPVAAEAVFTALAGFGIPITLVPLDATNTAPAGPLIALMNATPALTPEFVFARKLINEVALNWFDPALTTLYIWDAAAMMSFLEPAVNSGTQALLVTVTDETTLDKNVDGLCNPFVDPTTCDCTITITRTYTSETGQTNVDVAGNPMTVVTGYVTPLLYTSIVSRLNTPNANSARVPLQQPVGFYQYAPFVG